MERQQVFPVTTASHVTGQNPRTNTTLDVNVILKDIYDNSAKNQNMGEVSGQNENYVPERTVGGVVANLAGLHDNTAAEVLLKILNPIFAPVLKAETLLLKLDNVTFSNKATTYRLIGDRFPIIGYSYSNAIIASKNQSDITFIADLSSLVAHIKNVDGIQVNKPNLALLVINPGLKSRFLNDDPDGIESYSNTYANYIANNQPILTKNTFTVEGSEEFKPDPTDAIVKDSKGFGTNLICTNPSKDFDFATAASRTYSVMKGEIKAVNTKYCQLNGNVNNSITANCKVTVTYETPKYLFPYQTESTNILYSAIYEGNYAVSDTLTSFDGSVKSFYTSPKKSDYTKIGNVLNAADKKFKFYSTSGSLASGGNLLVLGSTDQIYANLPIQRVSGNLVTFYRRTSDGLWVQKGTEAVPDICAKIEMYEYRIKEEIQKDTFKNNYLLAKKL